LKDDTVGFVNDQLSHAKSNTKIDQRCL